MADDGTKQVSGSTGRRTVLALIPITYRVSLIYMGSRRVRHANGYRCRFDVKRGQAGSPNDPPLHPLELIRNVVQAPLPGLAAALANPVEGAGPAPAPQPPPSQDPAARALSDGGDNSNPDPDEYFRLLVVDNHGMRLDDVNTNNLLGSGADNHSKPRSYQNRTFTEDIFPIVPLRVVVRKFVGTVQVDLTPADLRVLWEIKDPEDEGIPGVGRGRARTFLNSFFQTNSRDSSVDGDDNCSTTYGGPAPHPQNGLRTPSTAAAPQPAGVKVDTILFTAPYDANPPLETAVAQPPIPPGGPAPPNPLENVHGHSDLTTPVAAHDTMRGLSELTGVQETALAGGQTVTAGVSDVVFKPYPVNGDNYRFLLTLTDPAGTDIRTTRENGRNIEIQDSTRRVIPNPYGYTTGRFVMWRSITVRLMIRANNLGAGVINFAAARRKYDDAFIELAGPQSNITLTRARWRLAVRRYFVGSGQTVIPMAQINNAANYSAAAYAGPNFFPPFIDTPPAGVAAGSLRGGPGAAAPYNQGSAAQRLAAWRTDLEFLHMDNITRNIIQSECTRLGIRRPRQSTRQRDSGPAVANGTGAGFFLLVTRDFTTSQQLLGGYLGEQQFNMTNGAANVTFNHELGHGLYLRHGVNFPIRPLRSVPYTPAGGGAATTLALYSMTVGQRNPLDHDQADVIECIMSYDNDTIATDFCAVCLMTLRYYDRVRLAANNRRRITRGWNQATMAELRRNAAGAWTLQGAPNNLGRVAPNNTMRVLTFARFEGSAGAPVTNDQANPAVGGTAGTIPAKVLDSVGGATVSVTPAGQGVTAAIAPSRNLTVVTAAAAATPGVYTVTLNAAGSNRASLNITVV